MEDNNKILSIVIVNWNAAEHTLQCLESIFSDNYVFTNPDKTEVILIDNNSADNSVELISEKFSSVKLISNKDNKGYAVACNQGMKIASGEYVLLLGNDTIIKPDTLSECINYLNQNENCGAVGCRLVFPDGRLQGNCKKFPKLRNAFFTYLSLHKLNYDYDMLWFNYDKTIAVDQIATTFLMIKNDILKKINYFDEKYKILYNDVDLCKKIWDSGYKIIFLHSVEIIHYGSHSTKRADYKIRKIMYEDIMRYYTGNFGIFAYLLFPVLLIRLFIISLFK